jgi:nucleolar protein 4
MGLRWLNAHTVTRDEIYEGLSEEEKKVAQAEKFNKRILVVEFAIEHANIIKRRREKMELARKEADTIKRRREGKGEDENGKQDGEVDEDIDDNLEDDDDDEEEEEDEYSKPAAKKQKKNDKKAKKKPQRKGNLNKGPQVGTKSKTTDTPSEATKSGLDEDTKKLIGLKRKRKQRKGK